MALPALLAIVLWAFGHQTDTASGSDGDISSDGGGLKQRIRRASHDRISHI
jgi:hypothetical protein